MGKSSQITLTQNKSSDLFCVSVIWPD